MDVNNLYHINLHKSDLNEIFYEINYHLINSVEINFDKINFKEFIFYIYIKLKLIYPQFLTQQF